MKIFTKKKNDDKRTFYFLSHPFFSYVKKPKITCINNGKNNKIEISPKYNLSLHIDGNNNSIILTEPSLTSTVYIYIHGDNNTIIIDNPELYRNLKIDIGHSLPFNNNYLIFQKESSIETAHIRVEQSNAKLSVGERSMISSNVFMRLGEVPHLIFNSKTKEYTDSSGEFIIGQHCWIGEGVTLLKKTQIPNNSIVATKSVVTKAFSEENVLIAGNPAKIRKKDVYWVKSIEHATTDEKVYIENYINYK